MVDGCGFVIEKSKSRNNDRDVPDACTTLGAMPLAGTMTPLLACTYLTAPDNILPFVV